MLHLKRVTIIYYHCVAALQTMVQRPPYQIQKNTINLNIELIQLMGLNITQVLIIPNQ